MQCIMQELLLINTNKRTPGSGLSLKFFRKTHSTQQRQAHKTTACRVSTQRGAGDLRLTDAALGMEYIGDRHAAGGVLRRRVGSAITVACELKTLAVQMIFHLSPPPRLVNFSSRHITFHCPLSPPPPPPWFWFGHFYSYCAALPSSKPLGLQLILTPLSLAPGSLLLPHLHRKRAGMQ
jgi:hypothetical protein